MFIAEPEKKLHSISRADIKIYPEKNLAPSAVENAAMTDVIRPATPEFMATPKSTSNGWSETNFACLAEVNFRKQLVKYADHFEFELL